MTLRILRKPHAGLTCLTYLCCDLSYLSVLWPVLPICAVLLLNKDLTMSYQPLSDTAVILKTKHRPSGQFGWATQAIGTGTLRKNLASTTSGLHHLISPPVVNVTAESQNTILYAYYKTKEPCLTMLSGTIKVRLICATVSLYKYAIYLY